MWEDEKKLGLCPVTKLTNSGLSSIRASFHGRSHISLLFKLSVAKFSVASGKIILSWIRVAHSVPPISRRRLFIVALPTLSCDYKSASSGQVPIEVYSLHSQDLVWSK